MSDCNILLLYRVLELYRILDAIFVFGTFIAVIWCSVAKLDPLVSDVVLLAGFLRLIRLPRLCCGLTSVESAQYRATITFYQQDESFHQHSLNILQHRLELSEIELQQLRQFVHTTQGPGSQLCSSRDYSEGSGTTKYYWNGAEHETLGLRLQNLRKVPLSEEFEGDGLTSGGFFPRMQILLQSKVHNSPLDRFFSRNIKRCLFSKLIQMMTGLLFILVNYIK
ncbi:unnamed protein product [Mesocestoides corti]|uniref:Uncharacterized protein n=1 Tax=Mesocestoides corti TaxID=53468 RepID=A0A0R3UG99_MESCO|nr:unnamed protein product [Mesocestoides corti]